MNIQSVNSYIQNYNNYNQNKTVSAPNFKAASDLTLHYMLKHRASYMPQSVLDKMKELCATQFHGLPTLEELHHKVYAKLMSAKTLEEAKALYPEFKEVKDSAILKGNRSLAVKAIEKQMPIEDFSLAYLKDLYSLTTADDIVKKYGFTNRNILNWLNERLSIPKPKSNYHNLVNMTNEAKNNRIAEASRQAIINNPEAQKQRLAKAAETHRTPEYREKKRQEMIDFYRREPAAAYRVHQISQMTWDRCPQIKAALAEFTYEQDGILKKALQDRTRGEKLDPAQKRMIAGYYKRFWEKHPEYREQYRQSRLEVIEEMKKEGLIL